MYSRGFITEENHGNYYPKYSEMNENICEIIGERFGSKKTHFYHDDVPVKVEKTLCEVKCMIPKSQDVSRSNFSIPVEKSKLNLQEGIREFEVIFQKHVQAMKSKHDRNTDTEFSKDQNTSNRGLITENDFTNQTFTDNRLYPCDICCQMFATKQSLDQHDLIHTNIIGISSDTSDERSLSETKHFNEENVDLKNKAVEHENEEVKCNIPVPLEKSELTLEQGLREFEAIYQKHKLAMENENNSKPEIQCSSEQNSSNSGLKLKNNFMNQTYTDDRLYACEICCKIFITKQSLDIHDLKHNHMGTLSPKTSDESSVSETGF